MALRLDSSNSATAPPPMVREDFRVRSLSMYVQQCSSQSAVCSLTLTLPCQMLLCDQLIARVWSITSLTALNNSSTAEYVARGVSAASEF